MHISDLSLLNEAAGAVSKQDSKITNPRVYYARKILSLLDEPGMTTAEIGRQLGKHRQTIYLTMKKPWFLKEQAKWHGKREARQEVVRQITMAQALDELHLQFASMLGECASVLKTALGSEDQRLAVDAAKTIIEKAEEAAAGPRDDDTPASLLGQIDKFLPAGEAHEETDEVQ